MKCTILAIVRSGTGSVRMPLWWERPYSAQKTGADQTGFE